MNEKTLSKIALKLEMTPTELLTAILERRKAALEN